MKMLIEFRTAEAAPHGTAVAHQVQVGLGDIGKPLAVGPFDPRLADRPLVGNGPIEHRSAARDLVYGYGDFLGNASQRRPDAGPGDGAQQRK